MLVNDEVYHFGSYPAYRQNWVTNPHASSPDYSSELYRQMEIQKLPDKMIDIKKIEFNQDRLYILSEKGDL